MPDWKLFQPFRLVGLVGIHKPGAMPQAVLFQAYSLTVSAGKTGKTWHPEGDPEWLNIQTKITSPRTFT